MLLPDIFSKHAIRPSGIIHIGAHMCQEREVYAMAGCGDDKVLWIEANPMMVQRVKETMPQTINIHAGVICDVTGPVEFHVSNNEQSSSILELGTHKREHPDVWYVDKLQLMGYSLADFVEGVLGDSLDQYDTLVMDIQGAEWHVLKGLAGRLGAFKHIYLEVNTDELYVGCGKLDTIRHLLQLHGFVMTDINMTQHKWGDAFFVRQSK